VSSASPHAAASGQSVSEHAARYETLRAYAVQRSALVTRDGLVVLLRQGVAAWLDAWSGLPAAPRPVRTERQRPSPLPEDASAEVVRILAAMTLGHVQEVHA
jgi:hypothetical protein